VWKENGVTCDDLDLFLAGKAGEAAALRHNVVRDQVFRAGKNSRRKFPAPADSTLRLRLDREEIRAIEANIAQQIGERVHGARN
jgi:hypothetical protein